METKKQQKKLIPIKTKSIAHIRCDERGNVLSVNSKNQFFFNGEKVYEGPYLHFDLHNGNYAISKEENENEVIYLNGKRVYTLKEEDLVFKEKMFYQFQMEDVPLYWRLLNDKIVSIERECLYYDGTLLLRKEQFDDYRVIGDRLFVEQQEKCRAYEVNLSNGKLIEVKAPKLKFIKEDGEGKFLFAFPNQFFRDGKMFFHLGWYLHNLGKKGNFKRFEWNRGVFAFEVTKEIRGKFRDTIKHTLYIEEKLIYEVSDGFWMTWDLVSGKLLHLEHGAIHYDGKVLFKPKERDEWKVINHNLFIRKGKRYYKVLLPEQL